MSIDSNRSCSCSGMNPNCFRCDGTGFIPTTQEVPPAKFFNRGLIKAGDRSPEDIQQRQLEERKREKANALKEAQLSEERESIRAIAAGRESAALAKLQGTPPPPSAPQQNRLPTTPAYRCLKCSYKWNRDPKAKCAWCNEVGPYELHQGQLSA